MSGLVETIITSPLMYIIVGVVLTFFTEWRIRVAIRRVTRSAEFREFVRAFIEALSEDRPKN